LQVELVLHEVNPPHTPDPLQVSPTVHALPSSHAVPAGAGEQIEGCPTHVKHDSIWHWALHPSPLVVFPSSHCSPDSMIPSPQIGAKSVTTPVPPVNVCTVK